jgi:hypothetical protein
MEDRAHQVPEQEMQRPPTTRQHPATAESHSPPNVSRRPHTFARWTCGTPLSQLHFQASAGGKPSVSADAGDQMLNHVRGSADLVLDVARRSVCGDLLKGSGAVERYRGGSYGRSSRAPKCSPAERGDRGPPRGPARRRSGDEALVEETCLGVAARRAVAAWADGGRGRRRSASGHVASRHRVRATAPQRSKPTHEANSPGLEVRTSRSVPLEHGAARASHGAHNLVLLTSTANPSRNHVWRPRGHGCWSPQCSWR